MDEFFFIVNLSLLSFPQQKRSESHRAVPDIQRLITSMNFDGAEGLEFGGGNTKVDPSVLAG
jgi:hypothetical protein